MGRSKPLNGTTGLVFPKGDQNKEDAGKGSEQENKDKDKGGEEGKENTISE